MPVRSAEAVWVGDLKKGQGKIKLESGVFEGNYSFGTRFEHEKGTNPEELIAAAHAGCFTMALAHSLSEAGYPPQNIHTTAKVHLETGQGGFAILRIELLTEAEVAGIQEEEFRRRAETAKKDCPVSKLLASAEISLRARLISSLER